MCKCILTSYEACQGIIVDTPIMPDQGFQVGIEGFEIDAWMTLYRSRGLGRGAGGRFHTDG